MSNTNDSQQTPRSMATLFCLDCGHESHVRGDWIVHEGVDGTAYVCPDCETTIITRRLPEPPPGEERCCQCD